MQLHSLFLLALSSLSLSSLSLNASVKSVDWQPHYDDPPVHAKHITALEAALPSQAVVPPKTDRRILVVSATQGYRHASIPLGKLALARLGENTGAFSAVVSDDPANFEPVALRQFDVVVLLSPTLDFFVPNNEAQAHFNEAEMQWLRARHRRLIENLLDFVAAGGGLVGIHSATDACYGHQKYGQAIGGYFGGHPWNASANVTIRVEQPEHPCVAPVFGDMDDFQLVEEIYKYRDEPNPRQVASVLLSLDLLRSDPVEGVDLETIDVPVAWVKAHGQGRVFYTSIGHNHHIYTNPLMLRHYLAGIQFAIGDLAGTTKPLP